MTHRLPVEVWDGKQWVSSRLLGMKPNTVFRMPMGGVFNMDYTEQMPLESVHLSVSDGFQCLDTGMVEGDGAVKTDTFDDLESAIAEQKIRNRGKNN